MSIRDELEAFAARCREDPTTPTWSGCDLAGAYLRGAYLRGANLVGCDLSYTHLDGANLEGANLQDACLVMANLRGADLSGANLRGASLCKTDLQGANLSGAKGIASAGPVGWHSRIVYGVQHPEGVLFQAGCFWGDEPALREAILARYGKDGSSLKEYLPGYLAAVDAITTALATEQGTEQEEVTKPALIDAIRAGMGLGTNLVGEACSFRDTHRRNAVDAEYAQVHPPKAPVPKKDPTERLQPPKPGPAFALREVDGGFDVLDASGNVVARFGAREKGKAERHLRSLNKGQAPAEAPAVTVTADVASAFGMGGLPGVTVIPALEEIPVPDVPSASRWRCAPSSVKRRSDHV